MHRLAERIGRQHIRRTPGLTGTAEDGYCWAWVGWDTAVVAAVAAGMAAAAGMVVAGTAAVVAAAGMVVAGIAAVVAAAEMVAYTSAIVERIGVTEADLGTDLDRILVDLGMVPPCAHIPFRAAIAACRDACIGCG